MASPITDGDILQFSTRATYQGQRIINTWLFQVDQFEVDDLDYEDFCNAALLDMKITDGFLDRVRNVSNLGMTYEEIRLQKIYPIRERAVVNAEALVGLVTGAGAPANVAAVITKQGDGSGRWAQGSWHQSAVPATFLLATGLLNPDYLEDLRDALLELLNIGSPTGFDGSTLQSVLWNKTVPARATPITALVQQNTSRVMRRRTVGLGI